MSTNLDFKVTRHFVRFLLPFSILHKGNSWTAPRQFRKVFANILENFEKSPLWEFIPHRQMQYILPYVEDFFITNLEDRKSPGNTFVFSMCNDEIQRIFGQRDTKVLLSRNLNKNNDPKKASKEWLLFSIHKINPLIYLFKTGIGLLVLDIEIDNKQPVQIFPYGENTIPRTEELNTEHLILFNRYLRKLLFKHELKSNLRTAFLLPQKDGGKNIRQITQEPFQIDAELHTRIHQQINAPIQQKQEKTTKQNSGKNITIEKQLTPLPINALFEFFLEPVGAQQKDWETLYEYRMMGYSYVQIRKESENGEPIEVTYEEIAKPLFWLRHYVAPEYLPSDSDLRLEGNPYIYRSFQNIYFGFSLEGGTTIVWESHSSFIKETFLERVRNEYFTLFLLALHQQMLSHRINKQINEIEMYSHRKKSKMIRHLREQIFEFLVQNWFPQVSSNLVYNEVYTRWQKVLQVDPLFTEIKREIDELDDYLERLHFGQESRMLNFITWFFFPFVFLVGVWGMNFKEIIENPLSILSSEALITSGVIVGGYYLLLIFLWLWNRWR